MDGQPLGHPFGWALIRLDGADTALLHAVDAGAPEQLRTGMRVRPRWAAGRAGSGITDIACFEPEPPDEPEPPAEPRAAWRDHRARRARHDDHDAGPAEL